MIASSKRWPCANWNSAKRMSKKIQMEAASTKRKPSADKSARSLRKQLLSWYDGAHRRLPWRETRDPYRIWVSEIMLQQTRVQAVIPYYERFLARFPNVESLAQAPEEQLLTLWSGLGYYSRARNLARAAQIIATRHGGAFPRSVEDAMALPGIGQYTAAAILSIAYGVRLAVLDGNVARVLSRVFAIPADSRSTQGRNILM